MPLEIECKYCDVDFAQLREKLSLNEAVPFGAHFEQNTLFETVPPSLSERHMLLRLRVIQGPDKPQQAFVTLKKPCRKHAGKDVKILDEREVSVSDAQIFRKILSGLGYRAFAAYEKVREIWKYQGVEVALDILPFGSFVELEGERDSIETAARDLSLDDYQRSTLSYHALHQRYAKKSRKEACDRSFTFEPAERKHWCMKLGIPCMNAVSLSKM